MEIHRQATQIGNIRFDRGTDGGEAASTKRGRVLERQIPINPTQPLVAAAREINYATEPSKIEIGNTPQRSYHEFMSFDQAGPAAIAYDSLYNLYAIKKLKHDPDKHESKARLFKHSVLVGILDLFWEGDELHVIYEYMDVSLRHILATPRGHLTSKEIAVVCKQVLNGLYYLHTVLLLSHGHLDCGQLLLDRTGRIKIANIGQSMFSDGSTTKQKDIQSLGTIMIEIMEPATFLTDPETNVLRYPERWNDGLGIKSFLSATATSDLVELQGHEYLRESLDEWKIFTALEKDFPNCKA